MYVSGECRWCNGGVSCERAQCNRVPLAAPTPAAREWVSWSSREATRAARALQNWQQPLHARLTRKLETRSSSQVIFSSGGTRSLPTSKQIPAPNSAALTRQGGAFWFSRRFVFHEPILTFRCARRVLFGSLNGRQTVCKFNSALARNEATRAKAQLVPRTSVSRAAFFHHTIRIVFFFTDSGRWWKVGRKCIILEASLSFVTASNLC